LLTLSADGAGRLLTVWSGLASSATGGLADCIVGNVGRSVVAIRDAIDPMLVQHSNEAASKHGKETVGSGVAAATGIDDGLNANPGDATASNGTNLPQTSIDPSHDIARHASGEDKQSILVRCLDRLEAALAESAEFDPSELGSRCRDLSRLVANQATSRTFGSKLAATVLHRTYQKREATSIAGVGSPQGNGSTRSSKMRTFTGPRLRKPSQRGARPDGDHPKEPIALRGILRRPAAATVGPGPALDEVPRGTNSVGSQSRVAISEQDGGDMASLGSNKSPSAPSKESIDRKQGTSIPGTPPAQ